MDETTWREIWVELGERRYPIYVGGGLLTRLCQYAERMRMPSSFLAVSNPTVRNLYGSRVDHNLRQAGYSCAWAMVPDSEEAKSLSVLGGLYDSAFQAGLDRRSAVLALGGGVVGDVAGFLAATYMRGVGFIQLPTTLLAQVDASVGGKVAINHPRDKNLIGAFYQPGLVLADIDTLATLPPRERSGGLAEVVKYGVIWDPDLFELLERRVALLQSFIRAGGGIETEAETAGLLTEIIGRCCRIKAEVVAADERDEGLRSILNFGHTVGHAVEAVAGYRRFRHGEAVSMGMVAAGRLAVRRGLWEAAAAARLERLLQAFDLPVSLPQDTPPEELLAVMAMDKKTLGGELNLILPLRLGKVALTERVAAKEVLQTLAACRI